MKINKNIIYIILSALAVILITLFIFYNSSKSHSDSINDSTFFSEIMTRTATDEKASSNNYDWLTFRKQAHIIEFAALGMAIVCLSYSLKKLKINLYGYGLFYALAIAVTDEYIQSFSDRSSSTQDIVLDFCGVMLGFLIMIAIILIIGFIKHFFKAPKLVKG